MELSARKGFQKLTVAEKRVGLRRGVKEASLLLMESMVSDMLGYWMLTLLLPCSDSQLGNSTGALGIFYYRAGSADISLNFRDVPCF